MQANTAKARRILYLKIKAPSADAAKLILSMIKNVSHLYKVFGGAKIRLLRNADDRAQFLQVIEYETDPSVESGRQKFASEPAMQNLVQAWRAMFPGTVDADIYEDVTEEP
ncbi:MAG TPA: hypothetical protein VFI98_06585 [Pseudolabrys sp.]|jgi:hypothetical protein|nr:hypothetical protein [Pseudolabrys sp.]